MGTAQLALMALAFYRGFRVPSLWSLNYYQLSWSDGFLRRGLLGTLLVPLGCARFDPHLVWTIQYAVLAAGLGVLLWLCRRGPASWALCLFLASDAGAFFFNEVGYPDQVLLLLGVACASLLPRGRHLALSVWMAVAVLVHEMAVFTVLPLVLALGWSLPAGQRPALWRLMAPAALALTALFAFSSPLSVQTLRRYADLAAGCGHPLGRPDFLGFYLEPFSQALGMYYNVWELCLQILPLSAALAWCFFGSPGLFVPGGPRPWAALLACIFPLFLGFLGWDTGRWIFLVLLQALLLLGLAGETEKRPDGPSRVRRLVRIFPLAALVLLLRIPLFDGFSPRPLSVAGILGFKSTFLEQFSAMPKR